jgi:hypothetical protein
MPSGKYVDEASRGPLAYAAHQEFKRRLASAPDDGDEIWPWWVCLPSFGVAFVILSLALMQRWHAEQSLMLPSLYGALAITPWVYDVVFVLRNWQPMLPLWLFPVLPMVGVPLLIARPVDMDVAPMLLVLLAGEIGSRDAKLRLVAHLARLPANSRDPTERLPLAELSEEILGVTVRKVIIPVAAGRNLAVLVEAAVRNEILKLRGIDSMAEFLARQTQEIKKSEQ